MTSELGHVVVREIKHAYTVLKHSNWLYISRSIEVDLQYL